MKAFIKLIRKVVFAFGFLYGLNLIISNANIFIPINVFSLSIATILGIPGIISMLVLYFIIT